VAACLDIVQGRVGAGAAGDQVPLQVPQAQPRQGAQRCAGSVQPGLHRAAVDGVLGRHVSIRLGGTSRPAGVPQGPRWHPEGDVLVHSGLAGDAVAVLADEAGLTGEGRAVVVFVAVLHDVGKASHSQVRDHGRIAPHGHAEAGADVAREALTAHGATDAFVARVVPLVREHMLATGSSGHPRRTVVSRLARRLAPATVAEWSLVCGADRAARRSGSGPNPTLTWLALAEAAGVDRKPSRPMLRGADLIALRYRPGRGFGAVFAAAPEAQDDGVFTNEAGARSWLAGLSADGSLDRLLGP